LKGWLCALVALGLSLGFVFAIPQDAAGLHPLLRGLNPDENDHMTYARKIRETGGLVRFPAKEIQAVRDRGEAESDELRALAETHQPPLYYVLGALLGGSLLALRLLSALLGALTVFLAYRAARQLFPEREEIAWGTAGLMATLPAAAQLAGAASNDALTTLLCTGVFWRLGLLVRQGATKKDTLVLALWLGAGLWTKLTVLQLFPLVLVALILSPPRGTGLEKQTPPMISGPGAIALAFLIASPWLGRNFLLYGDPFNLKIFPLTAPLGTPTPASMQAIPQLGLNPGSYFLLVLERSFATFHYILPPGKLWPQTGPLLVAVGIALSGLVGAVKLRSDRVLWLCLAAPLVLLPFFGRFNLQFFQAQGRYFHPALFPIALLTVAGLGALAGARWRGRVIFGVCVVWFLLSLLQIATRCQAL
jgi:4-amino-4-deoxy-L-arabinose transferase-like glycosyltransferase